jgi:hypothetical protein
MATDTPLIHDGAQCVAFANYFNPVSALAGPGGSGQFLAVVLQASRVVQIASSPTASPIYGVMQNTPMAQDAADVGIVGISKMIAGASITFGAELMVDASGRFVTWVAAASNWKAGMALETTSAANNIFTGLLYSPNVGHNI